VHEYKLLAFRGKHIHGRYCNQMVAAGYLPKSARRKETHVVFSGLGFIL
jgi:hypothetical protein